jgi:multidrug transporter EmrE-like cation transporter
VIVYPTCSVGAILAVTLAGVFLFRERLQKRQWMALGIIAAAVFFLNL